MFKCLELLTQLFFKEFFFLIGKLFFKYFYYKPNYNDCNYILWLSYEIFHRPLFLKYKFFNHYL